MHWYIVRIASLAVGAAFIPHSARTATYYVNANLTTGADDGTTWANAFRSTQNGTTPLQRALDAASMNEEPFDDLWVAAGTYKPSAIYPGGDDERRKTFFIPPGVRVYGGFAGTETARQQRNPLTHLTVLDGDFQDDDEPTNNCYHVVTFHRADYRTTKLSGFLIQNGYADGAGIDAVGAGILVTNVPHPDSPQGPSLDRLVIRWNFAAGHAAGLAVVANAATYAANCRFVGNLTTGFGGGVLVSDGSANLMNCVFYGNVAGISGGGVAVVDSPRRGEDARAYITNCTFHDNTAVIRGGLAMSFLYRGGFMYGAYGVPQTESLTAPGRSDDLAGWLRNADPAEVIEWYNAGMPPRP